MDEPFEMYVEAFAGLIERYDRRMAEVAEEIKVIEAELAKLGQAVRHSVSMAGAAVPDGPVIDTKAG